MAKSVEERLERAEKVMDMQLQASKLLAEQMQAVVLAVNAIVRVSRDGDIHTVLDTAISGARKMNAPTDVIETLKAIAKH
ncbi:hypothetical protein [Aurantimonas sp. C2-3-R2]|uniref:hypothetical protein n=1 Tax=Aurantimonas sp. C2-3-R2 TaxID=3114363 RepID=UPI002E193961